MIPATFPSVLDSSNRTKMLVYQVPSITGLTRWVDYIPVKSPVSESDLTLANTYANEGFILTSKVNDITGLVPFKDYVPIYLDSTAIKAWSADNDGYIPMAELAGLLLDFTTGSLDPRINFTRTSNATITKSDGTIIYAPHNLITYSEQFDNSTWGKVASGTGIIPVVTANTAIAPDGTITADTILFDRGAGTANGDTSYILKSITAVTSVGTASMWLKTTDGSSQRMTLRCGASTLTPIVVTGEWQRFESNAPSSTIDRFSLLLYGNNSDSQVVSVHAWGAQLEFNSTATTYNPTTVKNLLGYTEAFDNAAWTKSNSFVQTNLLTYSEAFDNAAWVKAAASIAANSVLAPNGYQTADTITATGAYGNAGQNSSTTAGVVTVSAYAKANTFGNIELIVTNNVTSFTNGVGVLFNLSTGTYVSQRSFGAGYSVNSYSIEPLNDGWYRCILTATVTAGTLQGFDIGLGASAISGSSIYIWGAQLAQGSVAGDYRRTDAAALPVYYPNHNGVVCAEKLVENTTNSTHQLSVSTTTGLAGGTYVASIYAKAAERTKVRLINSDNATGGATAIFDLSAGTVTYEGISGNYSAGSAGIESVGNGVYRCYVSATKNSSGNTNNTFIAQLYTTTATYTGDGTSGLYIFGAQVSDSASLDPYVLNAAAAPSAQAYYGARFDYDPVTLAPKGLLIEEQRANLYLQSGFAGAVAGTPGTAPTSWAFTLSGGTTNAIVTDGVGGNILSFSASAARQFVSQTTAILASTTYVSSIYINSNSGVVYQSIFSVSSVPAGATVTYFANNVAVTVGTYVPLAGDRLTAVIVNSTTAGNVVTRLGLGCSANDTGTVSFSKPQLEAGAFATSYIPTAASQVTRAADVATIQGSNFYGFYNQNEGSIFANSNPLALGTYRVININDGTGNNRILMSTLNASGQYLIQVGGTSQVDLTVSGGYTANIYSKQAIGYKLDNFANVINNGTVLTDTSGTTPLVNVFSLSSMNGTIKQISYYPQRLSDSVLKGLTA